MSKAFFRCASAEWVKLRTLPSTFIALACAVAFGIGVGALDTHSVAAHWTTMTPQDRATFDAVGEAFFGLQFGQLAFGVLGALVMTGEYGTGMICASLLATPRRRTLFAAKTAVLAVTTLLVGEALSFATFGVGQLMLASRHIGVSLGDPGVARAVASAGLYLAVVALVGTGVGAIVRHPAGAIAVLFGLIFLAWPAARAIEGWSYLPDRLLLSNAADVLAQVHATAPKPRLPSLGVAYADLALYLVVALAVGLWRTKRDP